MMHTITKSSKKKRKTMAKNKNKQRREKRKAKARKDTLTINNEKNNTQKTYTCHSGQTAIYFHDNGRALWIGGWKHGATFNQDTFVIDLTGDEDKYNNMPRAYGEQANTLLLAVAPTHGGWLSLPFPDFQTPKNMRTYAQWYEMAKGIKEILESDKDVLVACLGGHGRSGLFCAIVGYILNDGEGWENPVDKIRNIHCQSAIETEGQEQFVYDILGLDLVANTSDYYTGGFSQWEDNNFFESWKKCPKCGTESMHVKSNGMCLKCQDTAKTGKKVMDITVDMLSTVECNCENKNCLGTWVAEKCGHAVHDKLIIDGYCEKCCEENADKEKVAKQDSKQPSQKCEICGTHSAINAFWTGMCVGCAMQFENDETPTVHDTLTDNFILISHNCTDETCKGICVADICKHAVHNRYVVDGLCPQCYNKRELTRISQQEPK